MRLTSLETLIAVVERGSFVAAAAKVNVTPSAVSLQMKQLEVWFGRPLFDRSGTSVRVTPAAREIAAVVSSALAEVGRVRARPATSASGVLRLGAIPSVQKSSLPLALRIAKAAQQDLEIHLTLAVSKPLLEALSAGRIDAAIVVHPKDGGSSRLVWRDLASEPFVLVTPSSTGIHSAQELLKINPWIRYDTSLTGGRVAAHYVQRAVPGLRPAFEVADTDAIVAMVSEGLGVSVIPQPRAEIRQAYAIQEIPLGQGGPIRQISLVCRRTEAEDLRIAAIDDAFRQAYQHRSG